MAVLAGAIGILRGLALGRLVRLTSRRRIIAVSLILPVAAVVVRAMLRGILVGRPIRDRCVRVSCADC